MAPSGSRQRRLRGGGTVPGGMMGVRSKSKEESIRLYQGRNHYNEWTFLYVASSAGGPGGRASPAARVAAGGRGGPVAAAADGPAGFPGGGPAARAGGAAARAAVALRMPRRAPVAAAVAGRSVAATSPVRTTRRQRAVCAVDGTQFGSQLASR